MKNSPYSEPNPLWITGILLLLALSIIGIMLYVKIIFDRTQPEIGNSTTTSDTGSITDTPATNDTASAIDPNAADKDLSTVDSDINAYASSAAEIDSSIDDTQGDLSE